ncbi:MAG: hypothetical protein EOO65_04700 [Methanosarcinales archaeon]|nr:MAG: hypothetical protein EOO65_04700 [Methanosarcinales archaeon]
MGCTAASITATYSTTDVSIAAVIAPDVNVPVAECLSSVVESRVAPTEREPASSCASAPIIRKAEIVRSHVTGGMFNSYGVYCIEVQRSTGDRFVVEKRYSDFAAVFHLLSSSRHSAVQLRQHGFTCDFPEKALGSSWRTSITAHRVAAFQVLLNAFVSIAREAVSPANAHAHAIVSAFLQ